MRLGPRAQSNLKCRSSFFLFIYCEKNIRLNTEGVLTKKIGGCSEPLGDFHCDLDHLESVLLLSCLEVVQS